MYKVQIYCTAGSALTDSQKCYLERNGIVPNGVSTRNFSTKEALYCFVRRLDFHEGSGRAKVFKHNNFLESVMCNPNDSLRHKCAFNARNPNESYSLGYLTKDSRGRVVDLRNYASEVLTFDVRAYYYSQDAANREKRKAERAIREASWDKARELREGKEWWGYFHNPRIMPEKRQVFNDRYKGLIRGKRSLKNLPDSWSDEIPCVREKSWKARDKKARRQYEVRLPKHIATIQTTQKSFSSDDDEGDFYVP
jgi:hypothetical protein